MMRAAAVVVVVLASTFPADAAITPKDEFYAYQWGMTQSNAALAWDVTQGNASIIAVIDTGVDAEHPDLPRVLEGVDLIDDDGDAADENGHGTLIAGIIAAATNEVGVAGVAPTSRILPIRVLGPDGTGDASDVARGIDIAVDRGADVINLSLAEVEGSAGLVGGLMRAPEVDGAVRRAASSGVTVIVAAGNDHDDGGEPPTAYDATVDGVLVVGASTKSRERAAFSRYGRGLDLLAPGGGDPTDPSDEGCDERTGIVSTWWDPARKTGAYGAACGTSMAVAFVSGAAALLHATGMRNRDVTRRIVATAKDLGPRGRDDETGAGLLDIAAALGVSASRPRPTVTPRATVAPPRKVPTPGVGAAAPEPTRGVRSKAPIAGSDPLPPRTSSRTRETALALWLLVGVSVAHAWRASRASPVGTPAATRWRGRGRPR